MFIKKDLRKIPTILDEAVDCNVYDAYTIGDSDSDNDENLNQNDNTSGNRRVPKKKRTKREEPLKVLKLGRRKQEFEGCVRVLCQPSHVPKMKHLEVLNLYECDIHNLDGFGTMFETATPNLETLNLGRNPLSTIPDEFAKVQSLKHLWLDDCKIQGALPKALLHLSNIESLRLPNNQITHLDIGGIDTNLGKDRNNEGEEFEFEFHGNTNQHETSKVIPLLNLKILCLDRNKLGGTHKEKQDTPTTNNKIETEGKEPTEAMDEDPPASPGDAAMKDDNDLAATNDEESSGADDRPTFLPSNLADWAPNLEECFLRHNNLIEIGIQQWPLSLKILQVSSNKLTNLEEVVGEHRPLSLTHIYANGNQLESLPEGILNRHVTLERLVVSHNPPLTDMPSEVWQRLKKDKDGDINDKSIQILWQPNPNLNAPWADGIVPDTEYKNPKMRVC